MRSLALVVVILLWSSPVGAGDDPYRVTVDLGPSIRLLGSDDPVVREPAESLLEDLGADAVPALRAALQREDESVRVGVVEVLGSMDGKAVVDLLVEREESDPSIEVRAAALASLTSFEDPRVSERVSAALASDDPRLYRVAVRGCGKTCTSDADLDRLVALAFAEPATSFGAPRAALSRVASLPEQRAAVERAVERGVASKLDDPDPERRLRAALLLADLGDPRSLGSLTASLHEDVPMILRIQAVVALGTVGDADTVAQIAGSLDSLPKASRPAACKALVLLEKRNVTGAAEQAATHGCSGGR